MGQLLVGNFGRTDAALLTKRQLAAHPEIRRSGRWIEMRMAEGMPSQMEGNRRMFSLVECKAWLESRETRSANG